MRLFRKKKTPEEQEFEDIKNKVELVLSDFRQYPPTPEFLKQEYQRINEKRIKSRMNIKKGCTVTTDDFWYDLTDGGYLKPEEILEDPKDVKRVKDAIATIREFENSCEEQIDGFFR
ncbi:MAG: hypothetical protein ACOCQD_03475 [archaeon]